MNKSDRFNQWFNAFILIGMTVVTLLVTAFKLRDADSGQALLIIAAVGSLCGVLANVLSANGRILTFSVSVFSRAEQIGRAVHKRCIIANDRFLAKMEEKYKA